MVPGLGASIFGGLGSLSSYRPYFIAFSILMLSWTFYRHFRGRIRGAITAGGGAPGVLAALRPNTERDAGLYMGMAVVALLITFPYWGRPLFEGTKNSGVISRPAVPAGLTPGKNPCAPKNPCSASGNPCAVSKNPCSPK